ncbi:MipA/OmpV family protein [Paraglaciecola aquimarina]|uniref:MipA/OmpV family protein n=1 Tax=Paraglaciecola algarum TaxID=3050085 RepID=A0ABS9D6C5_9ALTE|nr:MipA/OmpV family protein [Paraglaciecola sp. G1-23]MCF2947572.1 MipA/OmpV family protein [Paraglaciecola sp. G1-23]
MHKISLVFFSAIFSLQVCSQEDIHLESDLRPVWEVGAFAAVFNTPEYPAADQNKTNVIASPYVVYRGEVLRIGDGAIARAVAVDKSWYELDLSLAASFGANSEDNLARENMPDLDFMFEVGPQLKMRIAEFEFAAHGRSELFLNLQARAAFSTDFSGLEHRGYVFQPQLAYRQRGWLSEKTALSIRISPSWATEDLQDYFYQVDNNFVSPQRAYFDAKSGYMGTNIGMSVSFDATRDIRMFVGGSMSIHSGAANIDSPLFKDKSTYSLGVGMVWRLWQSEQKVSGR